MDIGKLPVKSVLRFFGLLDVISIALLFGQIMPAFQDFYASEHSSVTVKAISLLRILMFISLFVSAVGLLMVRKFGIITYYIQFLFRFVTLIFSFGFITYINDLWPGENTLRFALWIAVFGEFLRMFNTFRIHRKYFRY